MHTKFNAAGEAARFRALMVMMVSEIGYKVGIERRRGSEKWESEGECLYVYRTSCWRWTIVSHGHCLRHRTIQGSEQHQ